MSFSRDPELLAKIEEIVRETERSRSETIEMLVKLAVSAWGSGTFKEAVEAAPLTRTDVENLVDKRLFGLLYARAKKAEGGEQ